MRRFLIKSTLHIYLYKVVNHRYITLTETEEARHAAASSEQQQHAERIAAEAIQVARLEVSRRQMEEQCRDAEEQSRAEEQQRLQEITRLETMATSLKSEIEDRKKALTNINTDLLSKSKERQEVLDRYALEDRERAERIGRDTAEVARLESLITSQSQKYARMLEEESIRTAERQQRAAATEADIKQMETRKAQLAVELASLEQSLYLRRQQTHSPETPTVNRHEQVMLYVANQLSSDDLTQQQQEPQPQQQEQEQPTEEQTQHEEEQEQLDEINSEQQDSDTQFSDSRNDDNDEESEEELDDTDADADYDVTKDKESDDESDNEVVSPLTTRSGRRRGLPKVSRKK